MCCSAPTDKQSSKTRTQNGGVASLRCGMMWEFSVLESCRFQQEVETWDMKWQQCDHQAYADASAWPYSSKRVSPSVLLVFCHLPARLFLRCWCVFVLKPLWNNGKTMFCFLSALPLLVSSSLFIHFLAPLKTVVLSTAAKINGRFCQVGHKWTQQHIIVH